MSRTVRCQGAAGGSNSDPDLSPYFFVDPCRAPPLSFCLNLPPPPLGPGPFDMSVFCLNANTHEDYLPYPHVGATWPTLGVASLVGFVKLGPAWPTTWVGDGPKPKAYSDLPPVGRYAPRTRGPRSKFFSDDNFPGSIYISPQHSPREALAGTHTWSERSEIQPTYADQPPVVVKHTSPLEVVTSPENCQGVPCSGFVSNFNTFSPSQPFSWSVSTHRARKRTKFFHNF